MYITLTNITKCFVIKKLTSHFMLKLPTNEVVFYPAKLIKELDDKTLSMTFAPKVEYKSNKARQEKGQWIRYDHKILNSEEIIHIILAHDQGAKQC